MLKEANGNITKMNVLLIEDKVKKLNSIVELNSYNG